LNHIPDDRNWMRIDALNDIPGRVKDNELDKAWSQLEQASEQFSDFDFIYTWQSTIAQKRGDLAAAEQILNRGLIKAKSSQVVCERLGFLEFEKGNLDKAVQWWIRSIVIMLENDGRLRWEPFLYLAYIAYACNIRQYYNQLNKTAAMISARGELVLLPDTVEHIEANLSSLDQDAVKAVLNRLIENYIHPSPRLTPHNEAGSSNKNKQVDQVIDADQAVSRSMRIAMLKKAAIYLLFCIACILIVLVAIYYNSPPASDTISDSPAVSKSDPAKLPEIKTSDKTGQPVQPDQPETIPAIIPESSDADRSQDKADTAPALAPESGNKTPVTLEENQTDKSAKVPSQRIKKVAEKKITQIRKTSGLKPKTKSPPDFRVKKKKDTQTD
jgi:tetratricopeptide (TPR) repeat protein